MAKFAMARYAVSILAILACLLLPWTLEWTPNAQHSTRRVPPHLSPALGVDHLSPSASSAVWTYMPVDAVAAATTTPLTSPPLVDPKTAPRSSKSSYAYSNSEFVHFFTTEPREIEARDSLVASALVTPSNNDEKHAAAPPRRRRRRRRRRRLVDDGKDQAGNSRRRVDESTTTILDTQQQQQQPHMPSCSLTYYYFELHILLFQIALLACSSFIQLYFVFKLAMMAIAVLVYMLAIGMHNIYESLAESMLDTAVDASSGLGSSNIASILLLKIEIFLQIFFFVVFLHLIDRRVLSFNCVVFISQFLSNCVILFIYVDV